MSAYMKKNERKAAILQRCLILMTAFFAIICVFLLGGAHMRSNQVQASSNQDVLYKSIRVDAGDTLWTIADEYMGGAYGDRDAYIDEVKDINHITESDIQAGSYIIVPYTAVVH